MEPPVNDSAAALRDEKSKVLRAMRSLRPEDVVRGQFDTYRDEPGVAPDSDVETYIALRCEIDSWRWAGVPFYIRAGKELPVTATEVLVEFAPPPQAFFRPTGDQAHPNHLTFRIKPGEKVAMSVQIKRPGDELVSRGVELAYHYDEHREGSRDDAYARLLADAVVGDQRLFARADSVEEAWRIIQPVLDAPPPVQRYAKGSWGPSDVPERLIPHGGWHDPELP